jgi:hypothetical protein
MGNMNEVALQAESAFTLTPRNLTEAMEFAKILASSDMVPKAYIGKPGNVLVAVQMGAELGLKPMQSLQGIASINGNPGVWGDAMWALILSHPEYEDSHEEKTDTQCTVTLKRRGKSAVIVTFSMEDAKKAGLAGKQGPWQTAPKRMLQMRARAFAARDLFADALKGIKSIEELRDYPTEPPERDITPAAAAVGAPGLPECTDDIFRENTPKWRQMVEKGKTPDDLIKFLSTRASFNEEQKKTIHSWAPAATAETENEKE